MSKWKTQYNLDWEDGALHPDFYSWVRKLPNTPTSAGCKCCPGSIIDLSNMGVQALKSHGKSKEHVKAIAVSSSKPISFFQK